MVLTKILDKEKKQVKASQNSLSYRFADLNVKMGQLDQKMRETVIYKVHPVENTFSKSKSNSLNSAHDKKLLWLRNAEICSPWQLFYFLWCQKTTDTKLHENKKRPIENQYSASRPKKWAQQYSSA